MDDEQIIEPDARQATEKPVIESTEPDIITEPIVLQPDAVVAPPPLPIVELTTTIPEPIPDAIITDQPLTIVPHTPIHKETYSSPPLPAPELSPDLPSSQSLTVEPVATEQGEGLSSTTGPSPITATFDIALLSDEQLKAAAALYTKRNQAELSRKGVAKRQETMELNLREIVDFLSINNGSPLPRIAKHTNITLGTTSKYLRQLQSKGKVRADGWGKNRRYYLK